MMENQSKSSEEIDLYYVLRPIGRAIQGIWTAIMNYFARIRANIFLYFVLLIIFILLGIGVWKYYPRSYETNGTFLTHILPAKLCASMLQDLNRDRTPELLAREMNIDAGIASTVKGLKIVVVQDSFPLPRNEFDDLAPSSASSFTVKIRVSSIEHIDSIQQGIAYFLENNQYALARKKARIRALLDLKENIRRQQVSLDSVKDLVNSSIVPRTSGHSVIMGQPIDPVNVYDAQIAYYRQSLGIDQMLSSSNSIEVLQPFLHLNNYNHPNDLLLLALIVFVVLFFPALFTPLLGRRKPANSL